MRQNFFDTVTQELLSMGDRITLEDLKKALKLKWRVAHDGEDTENGNDKEGKRALSFNDGDKCDRCGKKGHNADNCWATLTKQQLGGKGNPQRRSGNRRIGKNRKKITFIRKCSSTIC